MGQIRGPDKAKKKALNSTQPSACRFKEALLYKTEKLKCFLLKRTKGRTKGRRREREKAMIRDVDVFGTWLFWLFMLLFLTCAFGSDFIGCAMLVVYLGGIISFCMLLLGALAHGVLN